MPERGAKTSMVPVVWATEFFRRNPNDFLSRLVTVDETWLYHYDRRQKNNQWSGGIVAHPAPKNSECKNPLESSRLDFLESKRHIPNRWSSKGPNYQRGVLIIFAGAIKNILKEKRRAGRSPRGSCSCTTTPRLTGCLQPRRNWPLRPAIPLLPVPWTVKTIERSSFFVRRGGHCCRGDLVERTNFWIFFWVACES